MNEVDAGVGSDVKAFVAVPVCNACQTDPSHRQAPIKGTFFPADQAATAVAYAGERDASGTPTYTPRSDFLHT